jgi:hypothetical protein
MSKKSPPSVLNKVFRDTPIEWNGLTFHRFSLETQLIVMDAGLTFLYDPSVKLSVKEQIEQMTEFLYIHGTDPDLVAFKSDAPENYRLSVRQFARKIPMTGLVGLRGVVEQIVAGVPEATVDVQDKPSIGSNRETPPPN